MAEIRRAVDAEAGFVFVADPAVIPPETTPFDMPGVELGHRDGNCSFETILDRYEISIPSCGASP